MATKKRFGDPERQKQLQDTYDRLKKVRESKTVTLKPSRFMRDRFTSYDGSENDFKLRYYQVQGAYHLLVMKRMILGDDTGLGKTIEAISAFAHMVERDPKAKVVIVTPKSTVRQWAKEIQRFTTNIRPIIIETVPAAKSDGVSPLEQRKALYREWANAPTGPDDERVVLIINYALLIRDWNAEGYRPVKPNGKPDPKQPVVPGVLDKMIQDVTGVGPHLVVFLDECQAFRNMRTKTWETVRYLCDRAERVYGLTATPLTSNLMEGYCLFKAIKPELFTTKTKFLESYCHTKLQEIPGSKRKIPIVVGYHDLDRFRSRIDPFYLGRKKQDVSDELPVLVSKDIVCELSAAEDRKYSEALSGIFELGTGEIKDFEENRALVSLIYCQQVVDSLSLLQFKEGAEVGVEIDIETLDMKSLKVGALGAKEQALADLVGPDGELEGEKIIVYTRFASLVPRLQKILARDNIESLRITGKENDKKRAAAQEAFQDPNSDVKVIFITDAGGVGINLQMARALIFYDLPWTWGAYIQTLGRMIRIGSPHKGVVVYHLMAERAARRQRKTIDHHVYKLLKAKKDLIDKVLGEAAVGALDFKKGSNNILELVRALQGDGVEGTRAA